MIFKHLIILAICLLAISCGERKSANNLSSYKNNIIEQIAKETDSIYRVQIGIMAQSFYLDRKNDGFEKKLQLLQESLSQKKKLDIDVENGTNRIISVQEIKP